MDKKQYNNVIENTLKIEATYIMKKGVYYRFIFLIMIVLMVGCKNQKQNSIDISITDIINNKTTFVTEDGKSVYLKDYRLPNLYEDLYLIPEKYIYIDFDEDNVKELVLYTPNVGRYIVFYRGEKEIFVFEFVERAMIDLKTDGSFIQSEGAGINSYSRLSFNKNKYEVFEEAYSDDMNNVYRINGKKATSENVNKYKREFFKKESVNWKEISN